MSDLLQSSWFWLAIIATAVVFAWPQAGLWAQYRRRREASRRNRLEDALKHILTWENRGQNATPESLAGALGIGQGRVLRLIHRMQRRGLVRSEAGGLRLTPEGTRWAVHVVRAHRLWERYLSDDAQMPIGRLHQAAEKAEHALSPETLDQLEAHLGHPRHDPHGDPIPRMGASITEINAVPLTDWPTDRPARIVHIEDEPDVIFQQIVAEGLRVGMNLRVLEKDQTRIVVTDGEDVRRLAHVVAANIQVEEAMQESARLRGLKRLSDLAAGEGAEVAELDEQCRGFSRRRLLDLGLTPGARVEATLSNAFGDPTGYRVRGALIALRRQQADHVWVKPAETSAKTAQEKVTV